MMDLLIYYVLFLMKAVTLLLAIAGVALLIVVIVSRVLKQGGGGKRSGGEKEGRIEVTNYNERLDDLRDTLSMALLSPAERKLHEKDTRKREKEEAKEAARAAKRASKARGKSGARKEGQTSRESDGKDDDAAPGETRARVFVLDFDGDLRATAVETLRREITAVLTTATPADEIVVRLESGGGAVTGYGLAGSQLDRIRQHGTPLTVCVDKVAASGGYMMACVADHLVAAPFAVLGSIGVVAQIPNFHRLLKELNIDIEILTAGKYKRTLTLFGENTDEGREKFTHDIERIHEQFKQHVGERRPSLDMERVSTGEVWSGQDALDLQLVDRLATSDEYLVEASDSRDVLLVKFAPPKKGLLSRFSFGVEHAVDRMLLRWLERAQRHPLG